LAQFSAFFVFRKGKDSFWEGFESENKNHLYTRHDNEYEVLSTSFLAFAYHGWWKSDRIGQNGKNWTEFAD